MSIAVPETDAHTTTEALSPDGRENNLMRPEPVDTIATLLDEWSVTNHSTTVDIDKVNLHLEDASPTIDLGGVEVPATERGLEALCRHMGVPVKYVLSCPQDEQQFILTSRLHRMASERPTFGYSDSGLQEIREPGRFYVEPAQIVEDVAKVLPVESPVRDAWADANSLRLDVYTLDEDEAMARYGGGDRRVGDVTRGGVRIVQDRKNNRIPEVHGFLYRLWCTNGMESMEQTNFALDGRRSDIQEVFDIEFEAIVRHALQGVGESIQAFYDLRNEPLGNDATGAARRLGRDAGLSALAVGRIEDRLAQYEDPTRFDLVNLITNAANSNPRAAISRTLQRAAGRITGDHAMRCATCHQSLGR